MSFLSRNFRKFLIYLLVFSIPFNIKKYLFSLPFSFEVELSYRSAFLYLVDILSFLLLLVSLKDIKENFHFFKKFYLFLGGLLLSILGAYNIYLFFYFAIRLMLFTSFAGIVAFYVYKKEVNVRAIFLILGFSALLQSVLAILQFNHQSSLGLDFLGESVFSIKTTGIAKVFTNEGTFLRVYGTMPHPNILAAFLVLGFLSFVYIFLVEKRFIFLLPAFIVVFALFLTFSRSGILALALGTIMVAIYSLIQKTFKKEGMYLIFFLIVSVLATYLVLGNLFGARLYFSQKEPSFSYRVDYNLIGLSVVKQYPLFGVGLGNQVERALHLGLYQKYHLTRPWEWQPIHNLYLLVLSETGIIGFLSFAYLIFVPLFKATIILKRNFWERKSFDILYSTLILFIFLILGLVDHFFWDLVSGMLMFFLAVGLLQGNVDTFILGSQKINYENNKISAS